MTYLLSGTISGAATGNISNTATVTPPGGVTDPDSSNNSATDVDPLVINTPDNDTPFAAKDLQLGGVSTDTLGAPPNAQNWFRYTVRAGRSYCVEVDNGRGEISIRDTVLSLFRADTSTSIGTNDNITDEPGGPLLSRFCYIAPATEDNLANVTAGAANTTGTFRVRVVDTTVFCPWFFSGSGFEAFILIKNTTGRRERDRPSWPRRAGPRSAPRRNGAPQRQLQPAGVGGAPDGIRPLDGEWRGVHRPQRAAGGAGRERHVVELRGGGVVRHPGLAAAGQSLTATPDCGSGISYDPRGGPRLGHRPMSAVDADRT